MADPSLASTAVDADVLVIGTDEHQNLSLHPELDWVAFEESRAAAERGDTKIYDEFKKIAETRPKTKAISSVEVIASYHSPPRKRTVQDFVGYYTARFKALERILKNRPDFQHTTSIHRILSRREKDSVTFIASVSSKQETKNQNILLTLEDLTGEIKAVVSKSKPELYAQARDLVLDETIGVSGVNGNQVVFVSALCWPDMPLNRELKKSPEEGFALFLSDIHIGSRFFLKDSFQKFLEWINGNTGNETQRAIASKVKYIFIVGDTVDGVGIYPNQDAELDQKDIYGQYACAAELLKQIPSSIPIIICAGNHDAVRIAEPQPELPKDISQPLWELPNVKMVSNPSWVCIHRSENFKGFDVLLYHGYSLDYYVANSESVRAQGGYDRPDVLMKFLLTRRHLAPSHTSTLFIPDPEQDALVIERVPDVFVTGHIHKSAALTYKNTTLICGSCWQAKTAFQEKVGHNPEPGRVPLLNLQTRDIKILRF
ncbi:MAG: metallophosphoesterase [Nanoarchaeota archaeon]